VDLIDNIIVERMNAEEAVRDSIDRLYYKQQQIIEYSSYPKQFDCFQEGAVQKVPRELSMFNFDNKHILKAIKAFNKFRLTLSDELDEYKKTQNESRVDAYNDSMIRSGEHDSVARNIESTVSSNKIFYSNRLTSSVVDGAHATLITKILGKAETSVSLLTAGINELSKQFECKYNPIYNNNGTGLLMNPIGITSQDATLFVSKSEGFKLKNANFDIQIDLAQLLIMSPEDEKLFGQFVTGVLLHETFHGLITLIRSKNEKIWASIKRLVEKESNDAQGKILSSKSSFKTFKANIKTFVVNFMASNRLQKNDYNRKRTVNRLCYLLALSGDSAGAKHFVDQVQNGADNITEDEKSLDEAIKLWESINVTYKAIKIQKLAGYALIIILSGFFFGAGVVMSGIAAGVAIASGIVLGCYIGLCMLKDAVTKKIKNFFVRSKDESYCDMFAAMYQLPISFGSVKKQMALYNKCPDKVNRLHLLEQKFIDILGDEHPKIIDREVVSYNSAKYILANNKHLKKEVRDYLNYIIDSHEGIDKIDTQRSKRGKQQIDPELAKDVEKAMKDMIDSTGLAITESYIYEFCTFDQSYYDSYIND